MPLCQLLKASLLILITSRLTLSYPLAQEGGDAVSRRTVTVHPTPEPEVTARDVGSPTPSSFTTSTTTVVRRQNTATDYVNARRTPSIPRDDDDGPVSPTQTPCPKSYVNARAEPVDLADTSDIDKRDLPCIPLEPSHSDPARREAAVVDRTVSLPRNQNRSQDSPHTACPAGYVNARAEPVGAPEPRVVNARAEPLDSPEPGVVNARAQPRDDASDPEFVNARGEPLDSPAPGVVNARGESLDAPEPGVVNARGESLDAPEPDVVNARSESLDTPEPGVVNARDNLLCVPASTSKAAEAKRTAAPVPGVVNA